MADAARFPHLALPFAIVGAAGGWLSAGLVQQPLLSEMDVSFRLVTAGVAAVFGFATGLLLRRWCVGRRYSFQIDSPDPELRPASDTWVRHLPTLWLAGTLTGGIACSVSRMCTASFGALGGLLCTLPFLPICAAVLSTARRAQRARQGSIVAGADRRAVYGILAVALLIATLEGLPDDPAPATTWLEGPLPGLALFAMSTICILFILVADALALRKARSLVVPGLARKDEVDPGLERDDAARFDLGLGKDIHARLAKSTSAYRGRERALALILGDPERAVATLQRAVRRGVLAFAVTPFVLGAHLAAGSETAALRYREISCSLGNPKACEALAERSASLEQHDLVSAVAYHERSCDHGNGWSCLAVAKMYSGTQDVRPDAGMVALFEYRAAQRHVCPLGTILVADGAHSEMLCVAPNDPRARWYVEEK